MIFRGIAIFSLVVIYLGNSIVLREVQAQELEINAAFYVLVDLSKSYFNKDTKVEMARTLDQVNEALLGLSRRHPSPALFSFLSIDEISLGSKPLCEAVLRASVFGGGKSGKFGGMTLLKSRKKLGKFLGLCRDLILLQKPKMGTDISGAVDLAARMAMGQSRGTKAMIIISDFFEDRVKEAVTSELNLRGFRIGLIYRVRKSNAIDPKALDENIKTWRERLLKAGAEKVVVTIERGIFAPAIIDGLSP